MNHVRLAPNLRSFVIALGLVFAVATQAAADPRHWKRAGFTTDFSKTAVPFSEIFSGGPPKDGIPSIDAPSFAPVSDIDWLEDLEPVIRLEIDGVVKAYPLQVLIWHEIVNDTIAGREVAVTYCPLCNSSVVFDRRLDGKTLDFGTTGLLRNSDLVMYDRQTESWWQQFTGEAIVGAFVGRELQMIPSRVESFASLRDTTPNALVLQRPASARRDYGRNPYVGYDSRNAPYPFYQGDLPEGINPMARVVVVRDGDDIHAVTLAQLRETGRASFGAVEVRWREGQASILDTSRAAKGRDIGNVTAIKRLGGEETDLVHDVTFAFVIHAFHPDLPVAGFR